MFAANVCIPRERFERVRRAAVEQDGNGADERHPASLIDRLVEGERSSASRRARSAAPTRDAALRSESRPETRRRGRMGFNRRVPVLRWPLSLRRGERGSTAANSRRICCDVDWRQRPVGSGSLRASVAQRSSATCRLPNGARSRVARGRNEIP